VAYGLFGYSLVTRTRVLEASRGSLHRLTAWLLPLAALCDATENVLHLGLTAETRSGASSIYAASAGFSGLKWGLIVGFSALIVHALIRRRRP
jgi:hypothetical protein